MDRKDAFSVRRTGNGTYGYCMKNAGTVPAESMVLLNASGSAVMDLVLRVEAEGIPALIKEISYLPNGVPLELDTRSFQPEEELLLGLKERRETLVNVTLRKGEEVLLEEKTPLTLLPPEVWPGAGIRPETLAGFVRPEDPEASWLAARGRILLERRRVPGQADPEGGFSVAEAIFDAMRERRLTVEKREPAAEGETEIRSFSRLMQEKSGTAEEWTLLFASALEALGENPLLFLTGDRILCGVARRAGRPGELVRWDTEELMPLLGGSRPELLAADMTALGDGLSFFESRESALRILEARPDTVTVDTGAARQAGIAPMTAGEVAKAAERTPVRAFGKARETVSSLTPEERADAWERKLLDLSLRNALIHLRSGSRLIPLLTGDAGLFEDALSRGSEFMLTACPEELRPADGESLFEGLSREDWKTENGTEEALYTALTRRETDRIAKHLFRTVRTSLEESGSNPLYVALGLLRWSAESDGGRRHYAPIVLLPAEIVAKGQRGYTVRLRDGDPMMNITLLEKLRRDFGISVEGVNPLPEDENGVDIPAVFAAVERAVGGMGDWAVLRCAALGLFSFSQFVMWNDLHAHRDALMSNGTVRSLLTGKTPEGLLPMESGDTVSPEGVLTPVGLDASQLFAVKCASEGRSFVLHGPPGTGKSQTITAMIANALYEGKRVLFVAEKRAALEVVMRRLEAAGIGPFVLEMHSERTGKRDILAKLQETGSLNFESDERQYRETEREAAFLREETDAYARELHAVQRSGLSLFGMVNLYEESADAQEIAALPGDWVASLTAEDLAVRRRAVEKLVRAGRGVGHPAGHPLRSVTASEYDTALRSALPVAVTEHKKSLQGLSEALSALSRERKDVPLEEARRTPVTGREIARTMAETRLLLKLSAYPASWTGAENPGEVAERMKKLCTLSLDRMSLRDNLDALWKPEFLALDGQSMLNEWRDAQNKWFAGRLAAQSSLLRRMQPYYRAGGSVSKETLEDALETLAAYRRMEEETGALRAALGAAMEGENPILDTDWLLLRERVAEAETLCLRLDALTGSSAFRTALAARDEKSLLLNLTAAWDRYARTEETLNRLLYLKDPEESEDWIGESLNVCDALLWHGGELEAYMAYNRAKNEAAALRLMPLIEAYEKGLAHNGMAPAWEKAVCKALITETMAGSPALLRFSGELFEETVENLRRADETLRRFAGEELRRKLFEAMPDITRPAAPSSEVGVLQRAIRNGGRGLTVRGLFDRIPNLLPMLCPCLMMSPVSVAQYLNPEAEPFDLVIFDEASQIPTAKAVGSLLRSKAAVVAGDPCQMPPAAFFAEGTGEEETPESILDDCLRTGFPRTRLLWHYRSRREGLIAFSNAMFYENRLCTFPEADRSSTGVSLVHVDGTYGRGGTRTNRREAEAVVEELLRRSRDVVLREKSVGVVTFNSRQQELIEDLFTEACGENPRLAAWANREREPLFIKNLENVQGDERDVILISVGYGPDENGVVRINFGPVNPAGGWRRLNVALSRAREEMRVFSALRPEDVDTDRCGSDGVAALKAFLRYAAGEELPLREEELKRILKDVPAVAERICRLLSDAGLETECRVGRSGRQVDVAVRGKRNPERYVLGILLDGEEYAAAKNAEDRELNRIAVLEGLGWRIHRVWTPDWWENPGGETEKILKLLDEAERTDGTVPQSFPCDYVQELNVPGAQPEGLSKPAVRQLKAAPGEEVYRAIRLKTVPLTAEEFVLPTYRKAIENRLAAILQAEAPISAELVKKRLFQSFEITRAGSRMKEYLQLLLNGLAETGYYAAEQGQQRMTFYWQSKEQAETYALFRPSGNEKEDRREAADIPVQEAANAVVCILREQLGLTLEDLMKESAARMGFARTSAQTEALFRSAVRFAAGNGRIFRAGNVWQLRK